MSITAANLVKDGAEFLDSKVKEFPLTLENWRGRIDTSTLDLSSPRNCILGQLFGGYTTGKEKLGLYEMNEGCECGCDYDCDYDQAYGFVDGNHATNRELDAAWKAYLKGETPASRVKYYIAKDASNIAYLDHGRHASTKGVEFHALESGRMSGDKFVSGSGGISMWAAGDVKDLLKPYVPVKWVEGDHLIAEGPRGDQAFLVKKTWSGGKIGLRIWRLDAMPSHAPEDYWNEKGYKNFRKITI